MNSTRNPQTCASGLYKRLKTAGASISENGTVRQNPKTIVESPYARKQLDGVARIREKTLKSAAG